MFYFTWSVHIKLHNDIKKRHLDYVMKRRDNDIRFYCYNCRIAHLSQTTIMKRSLTHLLQFSDKITDPSDGELTGGHATIVHLAPQRRKLLAIRPGQEHFKGLIA